MKDTILVGRRPGLVRREKHQSKRLSLRGQDALIAPVQRINHGRHDSQVVDTLGNGLSDFVCHIGVIRAENPRVEHGGAVGHRCECGGRRCVAECGAALDVIGDQVIGALLNRANVLRDLAEVY